MVDARFAGIGMTSARTRDRLVQRLREQGITNPAVLERMRNVPRHIFVDEALGSRAYEDTALPIGFGQTISQPYIVARMTEALLEFGAVDKVLEVGSGCGYQTSVLAPLVTKLYSIERIAPLVERAKLRIKELDLKNVRLKHGDGSADLGEALDVDAIVITAGASHMPTALLKYLRRGGRMVLPLANADEPGTQRLTVIESGAGGFREQTYDAVRFVPLLPGTA